MATNTVPIEIVLQDPNNPIVPTPDSDGGSDNTNSNIAVPNTATGEGHTTMDGSSNNSNIFTGPTATVSIVSVVILALALSGIITLLIHKYYKNRKAKDNKEQIKTEKPIENTSTTSKYGGRFFRTRSKIEEPKKEEKEPPKIKIDISKYN